MIRPIYAQAHNIVACDINNTYFHNPKRGSRTPGTLPWLRPCSQCCRAGPNLCILSTSVDIMHDRNSTFESVSRK